MAAVRHFSEPLVDEYELVVRVHSRKDPRSKYWSVNIDWEGFFMLRGDMGEVLCRKTQVASGQVLQVRRVCEGRNQYESKILVQMLMCVKKLSRKAFAKIERRKFLEPQKSHYIIKSVPLAGRAGDTPFSLVHHLSSAQ
jgi:hypothetical protein